MIKLYYSPNSCAMSEHIVLEWIGKDYEAEQVQIGSEEFRKIAPKWAVPVMQDNKGEVMTQNSALMSYILQKHPESGLGSDGTIEGEYKLNSLMSFIESDLHPAFIPTFNPGGFTTQTDEVSLSAAKEAAFLRIDRQMTYLDEHLSTNTYMLWDKKSIVDASAFVVSRWANYIPKNVEQYPNISRFHKLMMEDTSVAKIVALHNPA
jgi:glutathione S-transferase